MNLVKKLVPRAGWIVALICGIVIGAAAGPVKFADDLMLRLGDEGGVKRSEMVFNLIRQNGAGARVLADSLDDLIVARYGETLGIVATNDEIDAEMASWSETRRQGLNEYFDEQMMRDVVGRQLVRQKVIDRIASDVVAENNIVVEDGDLMAFFVNEYAPANTAPEKVRFSLIQVASRSFAEQVLGKLRNGEDFGALARSYSIHHESASRNGDMQDLYELSTAPKALFPMVQAAIKLDVGQCSEIIEAGGTCFIVRTDMKVDRVEPRFADHKEQIRAMLTQRRAAPLMRRKFQQLVEDYPYELECGMFSREEIEAFRPMAKLAGRPAEQE